MQAGVSGLCQAVQAVPAVSANQGVPAAADLLPAAADLLPPVPAAVPGAFVPLLKAVTDAPG
jgi:hypothetical protein